MSAPNDKPAATEQTGRLLEMIHAGWTTQVLCCAVQLGLPDRLSSGVRSVAKLAADLNCNPEALRRLLRGLASLAIVTERGSDGYTLAPLGQRLRSDVPDSLCAQAEWFGRYAWPLWGELADSVRTGLSSRERRLGQNGYVHLDADRAAARVFNLAMVQLTRLVATSVASALDFTEVRRFVDIGGGYGELLVACLAANPRANGILLEMAHAVPGGQQHLDQAGLGDRAVAQEGNFFADIPPGADVYLLKAVLHNWDDTQCGAILANVRC
jgi:hypothetical protein